MFLYSMDYHYSLTCKYVLFDFHNLRLVIHFVGPAAEIYYSYSLRMAP